MAKTKKKDTEKKTTYVHEKTKTIDETNKTDNIAEPAGDTEDAGKTELAAAKASGARSEAETEDTSIEAVQAKVEKKPARKAKDEKEKAKQKKPGKESAKQKEAEEEAEQEKAAQSDSADKPDAKKQPPKKKKGKVIKSKKKKNKVVVFDAATISFYVVALVAVVALTALAVNIMAPGTFDRVFYSTPIDRNSMVMQIGEYKVMPDEYVQMVMTHKYQSGHTDAEYWSKNPSDNRSLLQYVEETLIMNYACVEWAKEYDIVLDDALKEEVNADIQKYIDENMGGDYEEFLALIDANFYTEDLYFRTAYTDEIRNRLFERLHEEAPFKVTQEDLDAYAQQYGVVSAKHILVLVDLEATEAQQKEKEALAQEIKRRLDNGEDFDTLMHEFSEDPGLEAYADGYQFETNVMYDEFYDATAALEVGEISDVVTTGAGYHIIMRVEDDLTKDVMRAGGQTVNYEDEIFSARLAEKMEEIKEATSIRYGRGYKYISVADITFEFQHAQSANTDTDLGDITDDSADTEDGDGENGGDGGDGDGGDGAEGDDSE